MHIHIEQVADIVIDSFFERFGFFCSWEALTFDQLAWLEIYANKNSLTIEQVKARWIEL